MSRSRRTLLLPALAILAALLLAAPASALPAFLDGEFGWTRLLEPLARLVHLYAPEGWDQDPVGRHGPPPPGGQDPTPGHNPPPGNNPPPGV